MSLRQTGKQQVFIRQNQTYSGEAQIFPDFENRNKMADNAIATCSKLFIIQYNVAANQLFLWFSVGDRFS